MALSDEEIRNLQNTATESLKAGDYQRAVKMFEEIVSHRPRFADVYNLLGQAYHGLGRLDDAIRSFEKSLQLNPLYTEAALNLAVTLFDIGRYEEANAVQERIQKEKRTSQSGHDEYAMKKLANMHAEIGDAYRALGMHEHASEEYIKALHLAPQFPDVRTKLAETYRDNGMIDEAIHELEQLKNARPDYIPARMALGISYYLKCKIDEAIAEWAHILKIDPSNKTAQAYLRLVKKDSECTPKN